MKTTNKQTTATFSLSLFIIVLLMSYSANAQKVYYYYVTAKIGSSEVYSGFTVSNVVSAPISDEDKVASQYKEEAAAILVFNNIVDAHAWRNDTFEEAKKARKAFMDRTKRNGKKILTGKFTYID